MATVEKTLVPVMLIVLIILAFLAQRPSPVTVTGVIYKADGITRTTREGGKDWWIEFINVDGERERAFTVEYSGSTYKAVADIKKLKSPVFSIYLYAGANDLDCVAERLVARTGRPIKINIAFTK